METYDPQLAARVWKRVTGEAPPPSADPDLQALIEEELADAAAYLHLSRFFRSPYDHILRQMHRQEQSHAACLKGIYRMSTGKRCTPRLPKPIREKPALTLQRCYDREMRCAARYNAESVHPRFGAAFLRMARHAGGEVVSCPELSTAIRTRHEGYDYISVLNPSPAEEKSLACAEGEYELLYADGVDLKITAGSGKLQKLPPLSVAFLKVTK